MASFCFCLARGPARAGLFGDSLSGLLIIIRDCDLSGGVAMLLPGGAKMARSEQGKRSKEERTRMTATCSCQIHGHCALPSRGVVAMGQ